MDAFSIDASALAEIGAILRRTNLSDPVVRLFERASTGQLFDNVDAAYSEGSSSIEALESMARGRFEKVESQLDVQVSYFPDTPGLRASA